MQRVLVILVIVVIGYGLTWAVAKYIATPPPTGEAYRLVPDWPRLPDDIDIGQVGGIGVDSGGDIFVFHRAEKVWEGEEIALERIPSKTLLILDAETGDLLDSWGADMFVMPHGLTIDYEDNVWLTDVGLHQVFKFDRAGNLLMA